MAIRQSSESEDLPAYHLGGTCQKSRKRGQHDADYIPKGDRKKKPSTNVSPDFKEREEGLLSRTIQRDRLKKKK